MDHRTHEAVRRQMQRQHLTLPAYPNAIFDASTSAFQPLQDSWSAIEPKMALRANADVDWCHGKARIPKEWPLTLQANDFELYAEDGTQLPLPEGAECSIDDVTAD